MWIILYNKQYKMNILIIIIFVCCFYDFRQELSETERTQRKREHIAQRHFELQYGVEEQERQRGHQPHVRL